MEAALLLMAGEIETYLTPLGEILARLGTGGGPVAALFQRLSRDMSRLEDAGFATLWERAVRADRDLELRTPEKDSLLQLGRVLGRYDAAAQTRAIARCAGDFRDFAALARTEAQQQGRMWTGLGAAAGVVAAVLLL